jgi:4-coumarate--CoA ligase
MIKTNRYVWAREREDDRPNSNQLYIDCNDPARFLSARETRKLVRQLVSGFNHYGLVDGDCVCAVSFNDVRPLSSFPGAFAHRL